jgi:PAS domain S-box-containing protein
MEDYVIAINKQMKVVFVNNSALQSIGYKEEELINKPVSLILAADVFKLSYDQALKKFPLRDYHAEIILKNKDKISVSVNASVLKEGLNDVAGFVFDLRDMRPTEELIKGLEQNKKDLEASKNELIVSQKELERKNEEFEKTNEKFKQINNLMVGRELKMTELKEEIEKLKEKLNQA